eukprot:3607042-Prymnesium_polylepis.1
MRSRLARMNTVQPIDVRHRPGSASIHSPVPARSKVAAPAPHCSLVRHNNQPDALGCAGFEDFS